MREIRLADPADFAGWRQAARRLALGGVEPGEIAWRVGDGVDDLFATPGIGSPPATGSLAVPRAYLDLAQHVALHRADDRFALLYRLLWRLQAEPALMHFAADPDVARAGLLAKAVRRDIHKMHAFVRFRQLGEGEAERFVAWYEPDHHIVAAAAPFFVRRFANECWSILTPERSAHWDRSRLTFGPGARAEEAPDEDRLEPLWIEYYASTFNPARVNPALMRSEMPERFWKNLPEAAAIGPLTDAARSRTAAMVERPAAPPVRRRGAEMQVAAAPELPAEGLAGVREQAKACRACPLWEPATQTVFGEGPDRARLVLVGEQPGDSEDLAGKPFVGPAGQLLDKALAEAGIDRRQAYVTNAVKHFKFTPRGKRRLHQKPNTLEIRACHPWLEQELVLVEPELVVAMGATAVQAIFGRAMPIGANRGKPLQAGKFRVLITVHPSYLLRLPDEADRAREYGAFVADLALVRDFAPSH